jgi:hypothetical protein
MAGVFDRLQKQLDETRKEGGMSLLDLADLPPALRKIMRLMLRQTKMNYAQLLAATDLLPEADRLARADLDEALSKLSESAWLVKIGEGERAIYKVNLRDRAGSKLPANIWQNLDSKLKG